MIYMYYSSIDRYHKSAAFKTLAGARRFAHKWVGEHPDTSMMFRYAVSNDGVGKVTWAGSDEATGHVAMAADLFPAKEG